MLLPHPGNNLPRRRGNPEWVEDLALVGYSPRRAAWRTSAYDGRRVLGNRRAWKGISDFTVVQVVLTKGLSWWLGIRITTDLDYTALGARSELDPSQILVENELIVSILRGQRSIETKYGYYSGGRAELVQVAQARVEPGGTSESGRLVQIGIALVLRSSKEKQAPYDQEARGRESFKRLSRRSKRAGSWNRGRLSNTQRGRDGLCGDEGESRLTWRKPGSKEHTSVRRVKLGGYPGIIGFVAASATAISLSWGRKKRSEDQEEEDY
ncbi:hypothetical protein B0H16DRAFT_1687108 [Mycena metata]|uniref:Uncharacterized protein n=1 Tax=Mycena metata TaxID=1033252 RepID=A0AAD7JJA7_9AGAR|nr:hypothetical protein B0H16DRAFT_1687108 [Mycena metata]